MKNIILFIFLFFAFTFLPLKFIAQTTQTEQTHISQLKSFYNLRDYEGGYKYGEKITESFPDNLELQAWFVLNFAHYEIDEAVIFSKNLVEKNKNNSWAEFANAYALIRNRKSKDALPIAEKLLKNSPENEDFIFLKASALFELDKNDEARDLLEKNAQVIKDKARFASIKGELLYYKAKTEDDRKAESLKKESFDDFAQARKIDPENVNAFYYSGLYLNREKRFVEAAQALKTAMRLSPKSLSVRREFWKTILEENTENVSPAKQRELAAAIKSFIAVRPVSSKTLYVVYMIYKDGGMNKEKDAAEKSLLVQFPNSSEAEELTMRSIYNFSYADKDGKVNEKNRAKAVKMLLAFIDRPKHFDLENLEQAYVRLFWAVKDDKTFKNEDYLKFADKAVNANPAIGAGFFPNLVSGLTERNLLTEAEIYARLGIKATEESLKNRYDWIKDEGVRRDFEKGLRNDMLGAFGKVLLREKKYDEAESLLIKAESFQFLGEMYLAQNKFDKAEDAYISNLMNAYQQDEAWKVIKGFYQKRNGSLTGYEQFEGKVKKIEATKRREKIIADKVEIPKIVQPFNLTDINGKPINFEDLRGKIVVVNIWGTWCEPCVEEMPEFQELYKKYANDKDVAILTIAQDEIEPIKKFMTEKKYDFPVTIGGSYLSKVGINIFPTTWFIDKTGNISYVKIGSSPKLLEEFGWRIEVLK